MNLQLHRFNLLKNKNQKQMKQLKIFMRTTILRPTENKNQLNRQLREK